MKPRQPRDSAVAVGANSCPVNAGEDEGGPVEPVNPDRPDVRASSASRHRERTHRPAVSPLQGHISRPKPSTCARSASVRSSPSTTTRAISVTREDIERRPKNLWRYRELLPIIGEPRTGFNSGFTPLVRCDRLAERLGLSELYIKDDSVNHPTLSYKDRVVSVAATRAVELGFKVLACASTGNLANSVAAHAARLGIECCVFIPDNLEAGKILGSAIYRPTILAIAGNYDDVNRLCSQVADRYGWGFVNINLRCVLRRGREDDGVRDRRAAGLAVSATISCRRSLAARCCRASSAGCASCSEIGLALATSRASTRRRPPGVRRSSARSMTASTIRSPSGPTPSPSRLRSATRPTAIRCIAAVRVDGRLGRGRQRRADPRRDSTAGRNRRHLHRAGRRHDARRRRSISFAAASSAGRIHRRLHHRQRLQDDRGRWQDGVCRPRATSAAHSRNSKLVRSRGRRRRD